MFLFFSMGSSLSNATNSSSVLSYSISHGWSYDPVDGCEITSCKHHGTKHPMVKKTVLKIGWLVFWNIFVSLFSIQLGINRSQLTNSIIFQRGRLNHRPVGFQHVSTILFGRAGFRNPPVRWSFAVSGGVDCSGGRAGFLLRSIPLVGWDIMTIIGWNIWLINSYNRLIIWIYSWDHNIINQRRSDTVQTAPFLLYHVSIGYAWFLHVSVTKSFNVDCYHRLVRPFWHEIVLKWDNREFSLHILVLLIKNPSLTQT